MSQAEHGEVSEIVIAHKDHLVSFGFRWFEKFASGHGCEFVVMDAEPLSPEEHSCIRLINFQGPLPDLEDPFYCGSGGADDAPRDYWCHADPWVHTIKHHVD